MGGGPRSPALYVLRGGGALAACAIMRTLRGAALRHAPRESTSHLTNACCRGIALGITGNWEAEATHRNSWYLGKHAKSSFAAALPPLPYSPATARLPAAGAHGDSIVKKSRSSRSKSSRRRGRDDARRLDREKLTIESPERREERHQGTLEEDNPGGMSSPRVPLCLSLPPPRQRPERREAPGLPDRKHAQTAGAGPGPAGEAWEGSQI